MTAQIEAVYRRIHAAARRAGRNPNDILLVAVTKSHPLKTVIEAYQAGLHHFGENRAQEGVKKVAGLADWLAQTTKQAPPTWHMIGHVQSRQVGDILGRFSLVHSLDSLKLAQRIHRLAERENYPPVEVLLECNVSGEASKFGFDLSNWSSNRAQLDTFLAAIDQMAALERVVIRGLMTMAPLVDDPEETRPVFQNLAALRVTLQQERPDIDWQHLSMGMTDDFEIAIAEGATIIRVGRALFGERLTC
ncbi:MAG: YggS family pyridoxal phosphate-dependent enzyme [Anaerolineae bacterium]|nr:YggS family pyridoxal phosphate-dependent enzyme [Anaerolineae bacterium]